MNQKPEITITEQTIYKVDVSYQVKTVICCNSGAYVVETVGEMTPDTEVWTFRTIAGLAKVAHGEVTVDDNYKYQGYLPLADKKDDLDGAIEMHDAAVGEIQDHLEMGYSADALCLGPEGEDHYQAARDAYEDELDGQVRAANAGRR